jgi:dTDP-4-dehydrorhamnose reductase
VKTVSILGATGFVGSRLLQRLGAGAGDRLRVTGTGWRRARPAEVAPLDTGDEAALAAHLEQGFDLLVMAAGTKDVARCERDPAYALALNARPVESLLEVVERRRLRTRIVYLSTDYVFDGLRGSYAEGDRPAPRTHYGRSKLAAEQAVLNAPGGHKVVRSAAVLGKGAGFFDWILAEIRCGREVRLFDDCYTSPTPMGLLEDMMAELLCSYDEVPERILHLVGERRMSRLEIGRSIAAMVPGAGARLLAEPRAAGGPLFQHDLSMVQSAFVRTRQRHSLGEYLAREVARG